LKSRREVIAFGRYWTRWDSHFRLRLKDITFLAWKLSQNGSGETWTFLGTFPKKTAAIHKIVDYGGVAAFEPTRMLKNPSLTFRA